MSREILFRGKRDGDGEWVMGDRAGYSDYVMIWDLIDKGVGYLVDPATVGQFTGLCDKNGVKIFEGDIVRCIALSNDHHQRGAIVISPVEVWNGNACLSVTYIPIYPFCIDHEMEVVGNIHDTPDLVKEEAE